jgi:hypothetical protein
MSARNPEAHLMFGLPVLETSLKARARTSGAQWFTERLATFALVVPILADLRFVQASVPWLTASTLVRKSSRGHRTLIDEHFFGLISGSTGRQDHEFCIDANIGTRSIPIESGLGCDEAMEEGREQEADLA